MVAGLTADDARARLEVYGPNTVPPPPSVTWWSRVLRQLRDPMIALLLAAGVVTTWTGDVPDTVIIALVVVLNTALGVVQEWRAQRAVEALAELAAPWAHVLRDGQTVRVPVAAVVPGDVLVLEAGDIVAADGDLVEAHSVQLEESALTGEALPQDRRVGESVEAGTTVVRGRARACVTRTGAATAMGRVATLVATSSAPATPLQQRLARLSGQLVVGVLLLASVVLVLGVGAGRSLSEMVVVALCLSVAAVPESLPAVVSIALALGAHRMAGRHAIVRQLPAVETLGSVTVLASDKTGTLTEGRMTAEGLWLPGRTSFVTVDEALSSLEGDERLAALVRGLVLCNDARPVQEHADHADAARDLGDPLETALLDLAVRLGVEAGSLRDAWPRMGEIPFEASTRHMVTLHRSREGERWLLLVKGAPERVLDRVVAGADVRDDIEELSRLAGRSGHRLLLVASHESSTRPDLARAPLEVAGMVALSDPIRPAAPGVVRDLAAAGIRLVMVTGDHASTATTVADRLGILATSPDVLTGGDLGADLARDVRAVGLFARVRPEEKVDVVRHLQQAGEVVAVTGDGVNDAPALRAADIGVAMGRNGTEVSRQAASLVLSDDELGTVVAAVEEGRRVYTNIRSFLRYGLAGGLAEVSVMVAGPFLGVPLPLLPAQILWVNLLTHGLPGVAFGGEPADPAAMHQPPRPPRQSILAGLAPSIVVAGAVIAVTALLAGSLGRATGGDLRSSIFVTLGLGQLGLALALRTRRRAPGSRAGALWWAVAVAAALQLAGVYVAPLNELLTTQPLPWSTLLVCVALALLPGAVLAALRRGGHKSHPPGTKEPSEPLVADPSVEGQVNP